MDASSAVLELLLLASESAGQRQREGDGEGEIHVLDGLIKMDRQAGQRDR